MPKNFEKEIFNLLKKEVKPEFITLEKPPNPEFGDIAFPCFSLSKELKKDPEEIAKDLSKRLKPKGLIIEIEARGAYVNFFIDWSKISQNILEEVLGKKENYGRRRRGGRKILVEHTSANPDGPLHLGHFRNTIIGDCLAKIMEFSGDDVQTESWLNDTGRQIAVAVYEYVNSNSKKPDKKPDWWVFDLYLKGNKRVEKNKEIEEEIKEMIKKFEAGDEKLKRLFSFLTKECIKGHKETFSKLGIRIDHFFRESKSLFDGSVMRILNRVKRLPEGKTEGKRIWVDLKKFGIEREFTLTREDGTTIYPARDLAYHEHKFSKAKFNLNVIGTDQKFYFKQLNSVLSLLFPKKAKNYHVVFYEFLLLPEGTMSTRTGKFISIDELLTNAFKEAKRVVSEKMPEYSEKLKEEIAKKVAVGALKYAMVKVSPEKTYAFKIKDALKFEGNTAPYIQYTFARACSILRKSGMKEIKKFDASLMKHPYEVGLIKMISEFPDVVQKSSRDFRPHYIANYAYNLATKFNEFYQYMPVLHAQENMRFARLALVKSVSIVLKNSLGLLGIEAPERM
jgi:arginyl-tRNA synthetase